MKNRQSKRRVLGALGLCGLIGSTLTVAPQPVDAAAQPHPVVLVPFTQENLLSIKVAPSGETVVGRASTEGQHVEVATGVVTDVVSPLDAQTFVPAGSDDTAGSRGSTMLLRRDLASGDLTTFEVEFPPDSSGSSASSWTIGDDLAVDDSGRYFAFQASNPVLAETRVFLYDAEAEAVPTWADAGLETESANSGLQSIAADGSYVVTRQFSTAGAAASSITRWEAEDGASTELDRPAELSAFLGDWEASDDLNWSLFPSEEPGVVDGGNATARLYLRDNRSLETSIVPVDVDAVTGYSVHDGGRVVLQVETDGSNSDQLFSWNGESAEVTLLSVDSEGNEGNGPVEAYFANADASAITFIGFADNLAPDARTAQRNVYQASLPTFRAAGKLDAGEELCRAVQGASAGEWVSVNLTPVQADATGFGTLHSSDDEAGSTSNVNFGPGTTDPNVAFAQVGTDGQICFTNSDLGEVHLVMDQLTVSPSDTFGAPTADGAARLIDTRAGDKLAAGERLCVIPVGTPNGSWVAMNITPVQADATGFGTLHSSDDEAGSTSNVNFGPGSTDPNVAFAQIGADGLVCFTNSDLGEVHVVMDQLAVSPADTFAAPTADGATRIIDTRTGDKLAAGERRCVATAGASAGEWVSVNLTPVQADATGFGTLHSSDDEAGSTSNVNFGPGTTDPNVAFAQVGTDGQICFTNSDLGEVHLVMDQLTVSATDAFAAPTADGAARLIDTRTDG